MVSEGKIYFAKTGENGDSLTEKVFLDPRMANRHGFICGATGTGKTVTLKVLAESFSAMGVPVFLADVKGELSGMSQPGQDRADMQDRAKRFGLAEDGFAYQGFPTQCFDIYGKRGIPAAHDRLGDRPAAAGGHPWAEQDAGGHPAGRVQAGGR